MVGAIYWFVYLRKGADVSSAHPIATSDVR